MYWIGTYKEIARKIYKDLMEIEKMQHNVVAEDVANENDTQHLTDTSPRQYSAGGISLKRSIWCFPCIRQQPHAAVTDVAYQRRKGLTRIEPSADTVSHIKISLFHLISM